METARKQLPSIDTRTEVSMQEKAFLVQGGRKFPISAECASKYAIFFLYADHRRLCDPTQPVNLLIKNNGDSFEVGPCRILTGDNLNGYSGCLVFSHNTYDVESLLSKNKAIKLQLPHNDLHIALACKNDVRPAFKEYVAHLSYDLSVYKKLFDDLDLKYSQEPELVRRAVQNAIIVTEGPDFRRFFEEKLDELKNLVSEFTPAEHQLHGFYFRRQLWNYILSCPFTARATLKPRGYPGDSELMRMIYLNNYQGDSTFSKLAHKHAVEHTAAQSVRYRTTLIAQLLNELKNSSSLPASERLKVLSVACGPAFELQQILRSAQDCDKYQFTLFDQDSAALSEAAEVANGIAESLGAPPLAEYVQGSVRLMLFSRQLKQKWGQFDFIYSMGLFDYLNSRVATAVLDRLYQILKPGGELVVGNFHVSNASRYYMQYWGEWVLLYRTEEEFRNLFRNDSHAKVSVLYDKTESQMFLHIKKPASNDEFKI